MADQKQPLTQSEFLKAMAEAVRRKQAGEDPELDPRVRAMLPKPGFPAPNIDPVMPDPERDANAAIERAANGTNRAPAPRFPGQDQKAPINPETGMRYYSAPEAQAEDPQDAERREIRMQLLREASKTGQMPEYLKKY